MGSTVFVFIGFVYWAGILLGALLLMGRPSGSRLKAVAIYAAVLGIVVALAWTYTWTRQFVVVPVLSVPVLASLLLRELVGTFWLSLAMIVVACPVVWGLSLRFARAGDGEVRQFRRAWHHMWRWALATVTLGAVFFCVLHVPLEGKTTYIGSDRSTEEYLIKPRLVEDMQLAEIISMGSAVLVSLAVLAWIYIKRGTSSRSVSAG